MMAPPTAPMPMGGAGAELPTSLAPRPTIGSRGRSRVSCVDGGLSGIRRRVDVPAAARTAALCQKLALVLLPSAPGSPPKRATRRRAPWRWTGRR